MKAEPLKAEPLKTGPLRNIVLLAAVLAVGAADADPQSGAGEAPVVISGTVADEASKAALLERLRALYGAGRVIDQLAVGAVSTPANWNTYVGRLIGPTCAW